jgi:putative transposase
MGTHQMNIEFLTTALTRTAKKSAAPSSLCFFPPVKLNVVYVEKGIFDGKRFDLTGGGLLRSTGGWAVLKGLRKVGIRVKGDERILGDSNFVENVLKSAEEELEQKYDLIARGYDFNRVAQRVAEVMEIEIEQVTAFGKSPQTVKARSRLCF